MALVSDTARFVFVHVPKTGGTSIRKALARYGTDVYFEQSSTTKHLRAQEILSEHPTVPFQDYFTFAFVRNPYDLLVSFWTYKMENPFHPDYVHVAELGSFERWVEHHVRQPGMAQSCFTHDVSGNQLVDYVGRFENFAHDVETIVTKLGCDIASVPHVNTSDHGVAEDLFTPRIRAVVAEAWRDDFSNFGYLR
jgi:hypothetical protein